MFRTISASLLWRGILAIAIGVVSVAWPQITLGAFVILFAVYALLIGGLDAVRAFADAHGGERFGYLLLGALSVAAGVLALVWPGLTVLVLTIWVGLWALVTGAIEVVLAFRRDESAAERALWALSGLIAIAFGAVLVARPGLGAVSLATVFGLFSIVSGVEALVLSARTRKAEQVVKPLVPSTV